MQSRVGEKQLFQKHFEVLVVAYAFNGVRVSSGDVTDKEIPQS